MTVSQHYFGLFLARDKAIDVKRVFRYPMIVGKGWSADRERWIMGV